MLESEISARLPCVIIKLHDHTVLECWGRDVIFFLEQGNWKQGLLYTGCGACIKIVSGHYRAVQPARMDFGGLDKGMEEITLEDYVMDALYPCLLPTASLLRVPIALAPLILTSIKSSPEDKTR